jgi:hypothetical protein
LISISPESMMSRFTSFLRKYYLGGASAWLLVVVLMNTMMMMYILGVDRFDEK